jgi:hypothetical protein
MDTAHNDARNPLDETFDELVKTLLEEWHVPGMSVAVIDGDQTFAKVGCCCEVFTLIPLTEQRDMVLQLFRANQLHPKHYSSLPVLQSHLRQRLYHYLSTTMLRNVLLRVNPVQLRRTSRSPGRLAWPPSSQMSLCYPIHIRRLT